MDDQASQGSFHLPSSMVDFSPSSTMDVTSQGSGAESDNSQQYVSGSRWHVRGGRRRSRRVTVRTRPSRGRRGIRERRCVSTRLSSRKGCDRPINSGSSSSTTYLSTATVAALNEIDYLVSKNEEPQSYTQQYTQAPGPTSPDFTGDSGTPVELFCHFFSDDVWGLIKCWYLYNK